MRKIEYEVDGFWGCTVCPYSSEIDGDCMVEDLHMVGSMACQNCQYFIAKNIETQVVVCDFSSRNELHSTGGKK